MVASRRKSLKTSLKTRLKELYLQVSELYNRRLNIPLDPEIAGSLKKRWRRMFRNFMVEKSSRSTEKTA